MPVVVATSVAAAWMFKDEEHRDAALAFGRLATDLALAPAIWWYEVRSLIVTNESLARAFALTLEQGIISLRVEIATIADDVPALELARRHTLTFYDAAHLDLAIIQRAPLATLDKALAVAARSEKIELVTSRE